MPYIQVNSERLFYAENCPLSNARLTMVLVHGAGENHLIWPPLLRRMNGVRVQALDLPGHNKSGGRGRASINDYVDVILAFLDTLDTERAVITGHSMGGAIAQLFALDHPTRVAGLILVATGARLRVAPAILGGFSNDVSATLDLVTRYEWGPSVPEQLVRLGRAQLEKVNPQVMANDYAACNAFDVMGRLGAISAPTLVIGGTADQMTPPKYAKFLADKISGAQLTMIEGAGHMVMLEQPELVTRHVEQFLATIP
jgi:pimeloyl-ACP methyl ester carboxylesterase